jgi:hypothetical protein
MTSTDRDRTWDDLRQAIGAAGQSKQRKSGEFWEVVFGTEDGLLFDGEGNDRTDVLRALVDRLDQTTNQAKALAERVAVLERLAVQDESRIAREIENLRRQGE